MAPPAHIKCVMTSSGVKPIWGLIILVEDQSAGVIYALSTVDHIFPLNMATRCVLLEVPCCCKCATRRLTDATAHAGRWPVVPCPMDYTLTKCLCVVKRRLTKVE